MRTGPQVILATKSCEKIPYDSHHFDAPVNYKKVADLIDITYSKRQKNDAEMLFSEMEESPKKPH